MSGFFPWQRRRPAARYPGLWPAVRAALEAHFGGHNEALVEFGVAPLRKRRVPQPADPQPLDPQVGPGPKE
ncbi:MAG: hypothetical protein ACLGI9_26635 [Thermoanaerobaculia bacterium]